MDPNFHFLLISDTHGFHRQMPYSSKKVSTIQRDHWDFVVHTGDCLRTGKSAPELHDFCQWFSSIPGDHHILVPGNHDWIFEKQASHARAIVKNHGIILLMNQAKSLKGLKFYGSPDQPIFCDWAFNRTSEQLIESYARIPKDTNVLLTHSPPFEQLDYVHDMIRPHAGSVELKARLEVVRPKLHVFGHIHCSRGVKPYGRTTYVNAACLTDFPFQIRPPIEMSLSKSWFNIDPDPVDKETQHVGNVQGSPEGNPEQQEGCSDDHRCSSSGGSEAWTV